MIFDVSVTRIEDRGITFRIEGAKSEDDAISKALEKALDTDFHSEGSLDNVEYDHGLTRFVQDESGDMIPVGYQIVSCDNTMPHRDFELYASLHCAVSELRDAIFTDPKLEYRLVPVHDGAIESPVFID